MKRRSRPKPTLLLMVLFALWLLAWGGSLLVYGVALSRAGWASPDGATLQRFLGWQGIAAMLALVLAVLSRRWPKRSPIRRYAILPIAAAAIWAAAFAVFAFNL